MILTSDWTMLCERQKGLLKKTKKGEHGPFVAPLFLDEPLLFIRYDTPTIIGKHFGTFDKNTGCGTRLSCSFFTEKSFGLFSLWLDTPRSKKVSVSLHLFDGNRFCLFMGSVQKGMFVGVGFTRPWMHINVVYDFLISV